MLTQVWQWNESKGENKTNPYHPVSRRLGLVAEDNLCRYYDAPEPLAGCRSILEGQGFLRVYLPSRADLVGKIAAENPHKLTADEN